jgi:hypothetical protein
MALTPFFGGNGRNSILDPFDLAFWDPVDSWPSSFFGRNAGRDVQAVASTRIDWVETPEAHVFKADLPGKHAILPRRSHLSQDCLHRRTCWLHSWGVLSYGKNCVARVVLRALHMQHQFRSVLPIIRILQFVSRLWDASPVTNKYCVGSCLPLSLIMKSCVHLPLFQGYKRRMWK